MVDCEKAVFSSMCLCTCQTTTTSLTSTTLSESTLTRTSMSSSTTANTVTTISTPTSLSPDNVAPLVFLTTYNLPGEGQPTPTSSTIFPDFTRTLAIVMSTATSTATPTVTDDPNGTNISARDATDEAQTGDVDLGLADALILWGAILGLGLCFCVKVCVSRTARKGNSPCLNPSLWPQRQG